MNTITFGFQNQITHPKLRKIIKKIQTSKQKEVLNLYNEHSPEQDTPVHQSQIGWQNKHKETQPDKPKAPYPLSASYNPSLLQETHPPATQHHKTLKISKQKSKQDNPFTKKP